MAAPQKYMNIMNLSKQLDETFRTRLCIIIYIYNSMLIQYKIYFNAEIIIILSHYLVELSIIVFHDIEEKTNEMVLQFVFQMLFNISKTFMIYLSMLDSTHMTVPYVTSYMDTMLVQYIVLVNV